MDSLETFRTPYKYDVYGNPIYARIAWKSDENQSKKPICLIYHAGGLVAGSSEIVPKPQIQYLCAKGFVVVLPNYRLIPQVTGKDAFADCEDAFEWTKKDLTSRMQTQHGRRLDTDNIVVVGHSSGGTMALHLASCKPIKAATAFYPFLFVADPSTNAHKSTTTPPFDQGATHAPSESEWQSIKPASEQLSEAELAVPGLKLNPRNKWMMQIFREGKWLQNVQPDGNLAAIDPMTRLHRSWAPSFIVHGEHDYVPGRSLDLVRRAEKEMKDVGINMELHIIRDAGHLFDHSPAIGTGDLGPKWQGVLGGLDWVAGCISSRSSL